MIFDTDVIIWYLRGNTKARRIIEKHPDFCLSIVSYIELVQGMRNREELGLFKRTLGEWGTRVIHIDEVISTKAMFLIERFFLSHSLQLADALIAASVVNREEVLLTGNGKHFSMIKDLQIRVFKP